MVIVAILLIYGTYMHYLMNRSLKETLNPEVDTLIILGAPVKNNQLTAILQSRLEKGAALLRENPNLLVIVTGGKENERSLSEAQIMENILVEKFNIEKHRIQMEGNSRNTYENLLYTKSLLANKQTAIITNEFHSVRVAFLAKRTGVNVQIIGVKSPQNKRYQLELREHIAILKSWLFDRY